MSLLVAEDPPVRSFEFRVACNWTLTRKLILYRVLHTKRGQNGCARRKNRGSPACGHRQQQIEKELSSQGRHRPRPFRKLFTHHRTIYLFNRRSITMTTVSPSHLGGRKRSPSWRVQVWNIPFPTRLAQERVRRGLSCSPIKAANLSSKVLSLMIRAGPMEHPGLMITSESDLALILSEKIRLLSSGGSRYFSFKSKLKRVVRAGWWNEPLIKNEALGSNQGHESFICLLSPASCKGGLAEIWSVLARWTLLENASPVEYFSGRGHPVGYAQPYRRSCIAKDTTGTTFITSQKPQHQLLPWDYMWQKSTPGLGYHSQCKVSNNLIWTAIQEDLALRVAE